MDNNSLLMILGIVAFFVTNVDEAFILAAFFTDPRYKYKEVVIGQFIGIIVLITLSAMSYFLKFILPTDWLGLLGIIPIIIGVKGLLEKSSEIKLQSIVENQKLRFKDLENSSHIAFLALLAFINGLDSIAIFIPLFVNFSLVQILLLAGVLLIMTCIQCLLPFYMVRMPILRNILQKLGHRLLKFVLIGLGIYIIVENETYLLFF